MKNIFIHVGFTKTGTCSIQSSCFRNRELLEEHNILYPNVGIYKNAHHLIPISVDRKLHKFAPEVCLDSYGNYINELLEASVRSKAENILISSEWFFKMPGEQIKILSSLKQHFKVTILVFFRRQDKWLESAFNQFNKSSSSNILPSFEYFVKINYNRLDYFNFLKLWEYYFGKNNVIPLLYQEEIFSKKTILKQLLDNIDESLDVEKIKNFHCLKQQLNVSSSQYVLMLLNKVKRNYMHRRDLSSLESLLRRYSDPQVCQKKYSQFTVEKRQELMEAFTESI